MRAAGAASHRGDAPATLLAQWVNMRIIDARPAPGRVVLEVGPIGRRGSHRILIEGVTRVVELADTVETDPDPDWVQLQIDIGDELYERQRYEEGDL